jgi:hypothetical protein
LNDIFSASFIASLLPLVARASNQPDKFTPNAALAHR